MLAAIGETLEQDGDDGEVMGVVVNVRKGFYRIGLWTRTVGKALPANEKTGVKARSKEEGEQVLMSLGKRFKEVLRLRDTEQVEFSGHTDAAHSGSTRAKAKMVI